MFKEYYNVIGVMSGTSLDGVDLAYIKFNNSGRWSFTICASETISYPTEWLTKLKNAIHFSPAELDELNVSYTKLLATLISEFISNHNLTAIDAICSKIMVRNKFLQQLMRFAVMVIRFCTSHKTDLHFRLEIFQFFEN